MQLEIISFRAKGWIKLIRRGNSYVVPEVPEV
jgi:hypothetical protein